MDNTTACPYTTGLAELYDEARSAANTYMAKAYLTFKEYEVHKFS
jgi:hypothetical protein